MKNLLLALVLMFVSGCSVFVDMPGAVVDSPFPKHEVIKSLYDYAYLWEYYFGEDIYDIVRDAEVKFYPKTEEEWNTNGCIRGFHYPDSGIVNVGYISDKEFFLQQTALWHELTHYVLGHLYNDEDANHSNPGGPWLDMHDSMISDLKKDWRRYDVDFSWKDN